MKKIASSYFLKLPQVQICAVTKTRSQDEIAQLIRSLAEANPPINLCHIAENRWPDCEGTFKWLADKHPQIKKHFIGPLQSNKVRKVLPLVDVVQSVDSCKLLQRINLVATELNKTIDFTFQVNISADAAKSGLLPDELPQIVEQYLSALTKDQLSNVNLIGLMTIGSQTELENRRQYFQQFRRLYDQINEKYFPNNPIPILSMGMSEDYEVAIQEGATMVRLGRVLFE